MTRVLVGLAACTLLAACAAQTPGDGPGRAGGIAPQAHPFTPTQADPIDPVTGMTDREMKVR
jgi:hypothetical protein